MIEHHFDLFRLELLADLAPEYLPGRVLTRLEIAENVWQTHFDTGTNFIDVYINYLRKKIDRDFEPKLIHTRTGMGFILTDRP